MLITESVACYLSAPLNFLLSPWETSQVCLCAPCNPPWVKWTPALLPREKIEVWSQSKWGLSCERAWVLGWEESTEHLRWKVGVGAAPEEAGTKEKLHERNGGSIMSPTDLALKLSPDLFTSSSLLYLTLCIFKFGIILPPNKQGCCRDRWQSNLVAIIILQFCLQLSLVTVWVQSS